MAGYINKSVQYGIALVIVFLLASTLILPQFSNAWRYCQAKEWVGTHGGTQTNCTVPYTAANTSAVAPAGGTHTEGGETNAVDTDTVGTDIYCLNCNTEGGYRSTVQGLTFLMLALGFIYFAVNFIPSRRFK